jgi:hypothetical protein
MSRLRFLAVASSAALALAVLGCGGSDEPYYIPADHEIRPFAPPDEEELAAEEGAAEEAAELDDWGESGTEEPRPSAEPPAAAPAAAQPAAPASPGKAAKPAKTAKPAEPKTGSESRSQ